MNKVAIVISALGIFTGLGGASHGPGEILQGNIAPNGVLIEAWPSLTELSGEPAMTIIPNFLVTGILTVLVGITLAAWSARYAYGRKGGSVLIGLSILLLFVGGGLIPPLFGIAAGTIALANYYKKERMERSKHE